MAGPSVALGARKSADANQFITKDKRKFSSLGTSPKVIAKLEEMAGTKSTGQLSFISFSLQGRGKSGARVQSAPSILGNLHQPVEYEKKIDD